MHILLTDNMSTRKTVQLSPNTYNELAKMGDLNSSFDSVIANLIKLAKQLPKTQK
jgi:predicted CopG family antitoxin